MSISAKRKFLGIVLCLGIFSMVFFPGITQAGVIPCGNSENPEPCTLCHFVVGFQGLINFGMKIIIYVAIAGIFASGIMYILTFADEGMVKKAKDMLTGTLKGFAFVVTGWLIINITLWVLSANVGMGQSATSKWYQLSCDRTSSVSNNASKK